MSYEEETTDLRARVRELEQALDEAPSRDRLRELEAERIDLLRESTDWAIKYQQRGKVTDAFYEQMKAERDELQAYIDRFGWNSDAKVRIAEVKRLDARVAELEDAVAHAAAHSRNKKDDAIFMRALRGFQIEKAREREAE